MSLHVYRKQGGHTIEVEVNASSPIWELLIINTNSFARNWHSQHPWLFPSWIQWWVLSRYYSYLRTYAYISEWQRRSKFSLWPRDVLISDQLSPEYKEAFALFDKRGKGTVPRETLGDLLRALGQNPTQTEVADIVASAPRDGTRPSPCPKI